MALYRTSSITLPRKIAVNYLFFCLAAGCSLVVGILLSVQSKSNDQTIDTWLTQVGRTAAILEMDYVRHGNDNLGPLVSRLAKEHSFVYCAIAGIKGEYLAHSTNVMVGQPVETFTGGQIRRGNVTSGTFTDVSGREIREFQIPLNAGKKPMGVLRVGTPASNPWSAWRQTAAMGPIAILAPLLLIGAGAIVISRQTRPLAKIESDLNGIARLNPGDGPELHTHPPRSAAAIGWNRIVSCLAEHPRHPYSEIAESATSKESVEVELNGIDDSSILNLIPDGIGTTDASGKVLQANPALSALLGLGGQLDSLIGTRLLDHVNTDSKADDAHGDSPFGDELNEQRIVSSEFVQGDALNQRTIRVNRYLCPETMLAKHIWTVRDITQLKIAERMREQFINTATHELRTPLANIKAYAETLVSINDMDEENQKQFCNTINAEASRLARFVDDLLSISSMEAGALSVDCQEIPVTGLLEEVVSKIKPLANHKSQSIKLDVPPKLPSLSIDKDKIVAMLVNLLGNAVKYTPQDGQIGLNVAVESGFVKIDVEDSGIGISAEELPQVFSKFFRSKDPRVANEKGTGLGLSLAHEIARLHGGDLTVKSEINKGSVFTVTLPVSEAGHASS